MRRALQVNPGVRQAAPVARVFYAMLDRLVDGLVGGMTWWERRRMSAIRWQPLYEAIKEEAASYPVFLETRDQVFVPIGQPGTADANVVALAISVAREGTPIWEMESPARDLAARISKLLGTEPLVLLSRNPNSFVGYYVRVKPT